MSNNDIICLELPVTEELREAVKTGNSIRLDIPRSTFIGDRAYDINHFNQKRIHSFLEKLIETTAAFFISVALAPYIFYFAGIPLTGVNQNMIAVGCFTVLAITRGYVFRRLGNKYTNYLARKNRGAHG